MNHGKNEKTQQLDKALNPLNIWALALGAIIGFGCFILPPDFLRDSGPLGVVLGLMLGAFAMILIGKNISFMVERYPVAGGQFAFAYRVLGKRNGFICGWMLSLCFISLISMNATALGVLAQYLAPDIFTRGYLYSIAGWDVYLPQICLSLFFIVMFGIFNYMGGEIAGNIQLAMVFLMIIAVLMIVIGTIFSPQASIANLSPAFPAGKSAASSILSMVALSPWLFVGFDTIPHAAEEFSFSSNKTFLLVIASISMGGFIYAAVTICTAMVWPWPEMVEMQYTWATGEALRQSIGMAGVAFLAVAICMGIFTGMNGFYLAGSRLLLSMSREHIISNCFGKVHEKYRSPSSAVIAAMVISLIAPFFGRTAIGWVVDMCSCGTAVAYLYTSVAARKVWKECLANGERPNIRAWVPVAGAVCSIAILALLMIPGSPGAMGKESWITLLVWGVIGAVFYRTESKRT